MENNQSTEQLTKKERKELRYQQRFEEKQKFTRQRTIKRIVKIALAVVVIIVIIGSFALYFAGRPSIPDGEIISRNGLHWHPKLSIFVNDKQQDIQANIGIGAVHKPIHTHDTSGVLHLEIQGLVQREDTKLGRFFEVWGKDFMEFGSSVSMTVNGEVNSDLENYLMKDGDKIELRYE